MSKKLNIWPDDPREKIIKVMNHIYSQGMTTTSGGNISVTDADGNIWITPSAVDKGSLKPSDIVLVKPDGAYDCRSIPSSELPFHKAIYQARPDLKAIVHAHPAALVSFSIVHKVPDTSGSALIREICGQVGYATYEIPGSEKLGEKIANEFRKGYKSILMENHAVTIGGSDLHDALRRFEALEFFAMALLYGEIIGTPMPLSKEQYNEFNSHTADLLPGIDSMVNIPEERNRREEICSIVRRACHRGLMYSCCGTISVRLGTDDFLITPEEISRWDLQDDDIVLIHGGRHEHGKKPDRSAMLHREIYREHPEINAVIMGQPPFLMGFALTETGFDVRTIPESWIFLQDVLSVPFGDRSKIAGLISKKNPAILIRNDSVLITGDSLLKAFDRFEVAELSAKSLVMAKSVGKLIPMNDKQIEDLRRIYLKD